MTTDERVEKLEEFIFAQKQRIHDFLSLPDQMNLYAESFDWYLDKLFEDFILMEAEANRLQRDYVKLCEECKCGVA
jgi:hypothetical protein